MKSIKEKHQFVVDNYKTMSNKEIAEELGYSVANIKAILHRLKLRRSKRKYRDKYDRIMMIAKKHGCKRTTDLIDIVGFEKYKEICKKA